MSYYSSELQARDGTRLYCHSWQVASPKAVILFAHGFFEHAGRYQREAAFFNAQGYDFLSYDQRSHGKSGGKLRSYISDFKEYLSDFLDFLDSKNTNGLPTFLFAHSMGGLVLISHLLYNKALPDNFRGVIFSAPLLMPDKNTAPLLQKMAGIVGTMMPTLKTVKIDANAVSRDPKEVQKYVEDPLNYTDKMYASSGHQLIKQMKRVQAEFKQFHHPFIVLHGTDDALAEIEGSRKLFAQSSSEDKEMVELKNYKHEITKDLGNHRVLQKISEWIAERI